MVYRVRIERTSLVFQTSVSTSFTTDTLVLATGLPASSNKSLLPSYHDVRVTGLEPANPLGSRPSALPTELHPDIRLALLADATSDLAAVL